MGIFGNLFGGKKKPPAPEPRVQAHLPYEVLEVSGDQAVDICLRLRKEEANKFTPVILGNPADLSILLEGCTENKVPAPELIRISERISIESFLSKRTAEDREYFSRAEVGEWPSDVSPSQNLTGHTDVLKRRPLKVVGICKVPTPNSWEVPAFLKFGDWNECPAPEEHVAVLRHWNRRFGADIITITNDILECTVPNPPKTREEAMQLAREQFVYCPDIVLQGTQTLSGLAATLLDGRTWYFWWD